MILQTTVNRLIYHVKSSLFDIAFHMAYHEIQLGVADLLSPYFPILLMQLKTKKSGVYFICLMCIGNQVFAEDARAPEVNIREKLSQLGKNTVGDSLPGIVITDPYVYISGYPGNYNYRLVTTESDSPDASFETHSKVDSGKDKLKKWTLKIDNDFIEEWRVDSEGNVHLVAQTDLNSGYRVVLSPHLLLPAGAGQGQRWKSESNLKVYDVSEPDAVAYNGKLLSNKVYEGRFEVNTPAGKFDAILISDEYEINIGAVNIKDQRYTFYAPDVGKIAEIDGSHVSAFLFFHERNNRVKVLKSFPRAVAQ